MPLATHSKATQDRFVIAPVLFPDSGVAAVALFVAEAGPSPRRTRLGQQAVGAAGERADAH